MADVSKGRGGAGSSRRNVRLTFLVEQIDMCDFPEGGGGSGVNRIPHPHF